MSSDETTERMLSKWTVIERIDSSFELQQSQGSICRVVSTEFYSRYVVAESRYLPDILKQWTYLRTRLPRQTPVFPESKVFLKKKWIKAHVTRLVLLEDAGSRPFVKNKDNDKNGQEKKKNSADDEEKKEEAKLRWMLDEEARICVRCDAPFGIIRRRHHCIFCGKIFCDACAPRRSFRNRRIKNVVTRQRICDKCALAYFKMFSESKYYIRPKKSERRRSSVDNNDDNVSRGVESLGHRPKQRSRIYVQVEKNTNGTSVSVRWPSPRKGGLYDLQYAEDSMWSAWETVRILVGDGGGDGDETLPSVSVSASAAKEEGMFGRYTLCGLERGTKYVVRIAKAVGKHKHHKWGPQTRFRTVERVTNECLETERMVGSRREKEGGGDDVVVVESTKDEEKIGGESQQHNDSSTKREDDDVPPPISAFTTSPFRMIPQRISHNNHMKKKKEEVAGEDNDSSVDVVVSTSKSKSKSKRRNDDDNMSSQHQHTPSTKRHHHHYHDHTKDNDERHHLWSVIAVSMSLGFFMWPCSEHLYNTYVLAASDDEFSILRTLFSLFAFFTTLAVTLGTFSVMDALGLVQTSSSKKSQRRRQRRRRRSHRILSHSSQSHATDDDGSSADDNDGSSADDDDDVSDDSSASDEKMPLGFLEKDRMDTFEGVSMVATMASRWRRRVDSNRHIKKSLSASSQRSRRRRSLSSGMSSYAFVEEMVNAGRIDPSLAPPSKVYGKLRARLSPSIPKLMPHNAYFFLNRDTCPMPFETPLFRGRAVIRVRGADGAPKTRYFEGKRRMFSIQVEGRFRRRIRGDSVIFGAAFDHPIILPYGTSLGLSLLHRIDPAVQEDLRGSQPWAMSPLLCAMSRISVKPAPRVGGLDMNRTNASSSYACAGDEIFGSWTFGGSHRLEEKSELLLSESERKRMASKLPWKEGQRRRYFQKKKHREQVWFDPKYVYGFEFLSSRIDLTSYNVSLAIHISMCKYLNGQPLRFEARANDDMMPSHEALWSVEFPHDDLAMYSKKQRV